MRKLVLLASTAALLATVSLARAEEQQEADA